MVSSTITSVEDAALAAPIVDALNRISACAHQRAGLEARGLRETLADYSEGIDLPEDDNRRDREHDAPFVAFNGGREGLGAEDRTMSRGCSSTNFTITDDPFDEDGDPYFLNVAAPMPDDPRGRDGWCVDICLWVPVPGYDSRASGEGVLSCDLTTDQPGSAQCPRGSRLACGGVTRADG